MNKLALIGQGAKVPSSRFRLEQYLPLWRRPELDIQLFQAKNSAYPPQQSYKRPFWMLSELSCRAGQLSAINQSNLVVLQRQMISTLCTLEPMIKSPMVMDVDDAIFLQRSGHAANKIARLSERVVCGNHYLAEHFSAYNRNISVIPTAVDTERFVPGQRTQEELFIGWSGSSSGFNYLYEIEPALLQALKLNPAWRLLITSDKAPAFQQIPAERIKFVQWTADNEVECIQQMSIGLMPLQDSMWTRGKCSYKMLLYMACGVAVAVSRVGMNSDILAEAEVGVGAVDQQQWLAALQLLMNDAAARKTFGEKGRALVVEKYSLLACNTKWQSIFAHYF
jgi:glycosyltransferase involved in cell wall biosynthesis